MITALLRAIQACSRCSSGSERSPSANAITTGVATPSEPIAVKDDERDRLLSGW